MSALKQMQIWCFYLKSEQERMKFVVGYRYS